MKYATAFIFLAALTLSGLALWDGLVIQAVLVYLAFGFFICATAYAFRWPALWGKRGD